MLYDNLLQKILAGQFRPESALGIDDTETDGQMGISKIDRYAVPTGKAALLFLNMKAPAEIWQDMTSLP